MWVSKIPAKELFVQISRKLKKTWYRLRFRRLLSADICKIPWCTESEASLQNRDAHFQIDIFYVFPKENGSHIYLHRKWLVFAAHHS